MSPPAMTVINARQRFFRKLIDDPSTRLDRLCRFFDDGQLEYILRADDGGQDFIISTVKAEIERRQGSM